MDQDIRFCTTSDGVRIAYAVVGSGPPLVRVLGWFTHLELDWQAPWVKALVEELGSRYTYIRYDGRGMGLSDRDVEDFSLDALVRDLAAVVDATSYDKVVLEGISQGGPVAIAYAVLHPERVSHLILYGSFAHLPPPRTTEQAEMREAVLTLVRQGWGSNKPAFRQTFTAMFMPDAEPERIQWFNELQRASATPETAAKFIENVYKLDVRDILKDVGVPTLVLHARRDQAVSFKGGRDLAAGIPNARFIPLESDNHALKTEEPAFLEFERAVDEFIGVEAARQPDASLPSGTAIILFLDIADSTALTERLGDAAFRAKARDLDEALRAAIREHAGTPIEGKLLGDGVLATFAAARDAIACAQSCRIAADNAGLPLHIGLHAGDVLHEEGNVYGGAVNIAARISGEAAPGDVLVSDIVRGLARTSAGVTFEDRGERELKGVSDPVRLWAVRERA